MKKVLKLNKVIGQELTKAEIKNLKGGIGANVGIENTIDCPTGCGLEDEAFSGGTMSKAVAQ
ncbi:MAG: hypothetical protein PF638_07355 [Candidatus Delongbacteria bacterium]|jgi:hypothetical protein|nr:hypothetical protein [Candidatus Delongbacteria bacterium]